jgi:glycosyltransferase involved in cell wall biosynthesis
VFFMNIGVLCKFSFPEELGGILVVHANLIKALREKDVQIITISPSEESSEGYFISEKSKVIKSKRFHQLIKDYNNSVYNGTFNEVDYIELIEGCAKDLTEELKKSRLDILLGYTALDWLLGWRIARNLNIPFVPVLHGTIYSESQLLYYAPLHPFSLNVLKSNYLVMKDIFWPRKYDGLIAVSKFAKNQYINWNVPSEDIHVIYNGVDINQFNQNRRSNIAKENYEILLPAIMSRRKGIGLAIAMIANLSKSIPNISLNLCPANSLLDGRDPVKDIYKEIAEYYNVTDKIKCNLYTYEEMKNVYYDADLVIMPTESETFGLPVIEAMASGTPILTSDQGAFTEIITHEKNGLIFNINSVEQFTNEANRALLDVQLKEKIISNGLLRAKDFHYEEMGNNYLKYLKSII